LYDTGATELADFYRGGQKNIGHPSPEMTVRKREDYMEHLVFSAIPESENLAQDLESQLATAIRLIAAQEDSSVKTQEAASKRFALSAPLAVNTADFALRITRDSIKEVQARIEAARGELESLSAMTSMKLNHYRNTAARENLAKHTLYSSALVLRSSQRAVEVLENKLRIARHVIAAKVVAKTMKKQNQTPYFGEAATPQSQEGTAKRLKNGKKNNAFERRVTLTEQHDAEQRVLRAAAALFELGVMDQSGLDYYGLVDLRNPNPAPDIGRRTDSGYWSDLLIGRARVAAVLLERTLAVAQRLMLEQELISRAPDAVEEHFLQVPPCLASETLHKIPTTPKARKTATRPL